METLDSGCDTSIARETFQSLVGVLGEESQASASELRRALIAVCKEPALVIVERVPPGEGLKVWGLLSRKYEPSSAS